LGPSLAHPCVTISSPERQTNSEVVRPRRLDNMEKKAPKRKKTAALTAEYNRYPAAWPYIPVRHSRTLGAPLLNKRGRKQPSRLKAVLSGSDGWSRVSSLRLLLRPNRSDRSDPSASLRRGLFPPAPPPKRIVIVDSSIIQQRLEYGPKRPAGRACAWMPAPPAGTCPFPVAIMGHGGRAGGGRPTKPKEDITRRSGRVTQSRTFACSPSITASRPPTNKPLARMFFEDLPAR